MKITTKAHYGLMAMVRLAQNEGEGPLSIREIAREQRLSDSYMEQLIALLKKAGLVTSVRGSQGGYRLSKPSDEITAGEIFKALEGPLSFTACAGDEADRSCAIEGACASRRFWQQLYDHMNGFLDSMSLADMIREEA